MAQRAYWAGLLYVKKDRISQIELLLAPFDMNLKTIAYLNHIGTHPAATDLAVLNAIEFHNKSGANAKKIVCATYSGIGQIRFGTCQELLSILQRNSSVHVESETWDWKKPSPEIWEPS